MRLKLQPNLLKYIFIINLLFSGGLLFSQDKENIERVEEHHNTEDLEELLKKYHADQQKIVEEKSFEEVNPPEAPPEIKKTPTPERKNEFHLAKSIRVALEPLQEMSEGELIKRMDEATKGSKFRPYMDQFPKITLFAIRLIKDPESLPSLVKILENKDRLIWFFSAMIFSLVLGIILKKIMHNKEQAFLKKVFYFFLRVYILFIVRACIFYFFFNKELGPTIKIFKKTFF